MHNGSSAACTRRRRAFAGGAVMALLLVTLPVVPVYASEVAPETVSAQLEDVAVESREEFEPGDDVDDGEATEAAEADDATERGEAPEDVGEDGQQDEAEARGEAEPVDPGVVRERSEVVESPIPFTGLGFMGDGREAPELYWRALREDGSWTDWSLVEALDGYDGPDPGSPEARDTAASAGRWVSDALWVGAATHLQIMVEGVSLDEIDITVIDSAGLSETVFQRASRALRSLTTVQPAEASTGGPSIVPRSGWGANESCTKGSISYATPRAGVLHHTATTNDYTRAEAPQQIRNMYHWHTACHGSGNGWNDIGYNFIIDRFGTIYEGRRGGVTEGVIGAHAGGWNTGTFGVGIMGHHNLAVPSAASLDAAARLIGWKYSLHGIDPSSSATTYLNGQAIPTLVGHRNVRGSYQASPTTTTDCSGQYLYTRMSVLRSSAEAVAPRIWTPVVGDWNADGRTTIGWYSEGQWRLRNANSSGGASTAFSFGRAGDLPVVGDWNGDGRTTVGVVRESQWFLRNSNSGGPGEVSFHYGRGAIDFPMAGDWNGNGFDTPGIVRDGDWHLRNSLSGGNGQITFTYGRITQGDLPIVGDWNGNGRDTPGIIRDREWHLRYSLSGGPGETVFIYGQITNGDLPVVGDWNRSGGDGIGVVRDRDWHLRNSLSGGPAHLSFNYGW